MPELPEVETIRRDLEKQLLHKTFHSISVHDPFVLRTPENEFIQLLKKQSIKAVIRKGKALTLHLSNDHHLLVQVMMTGQMLVGAKADKHTRVTFKFSDGSQVLYNDQRRFGQLRIIKDFSEVKYFNILGPEPFDKGFNPNYIFECTRKLKRPIKNLLLDHTFVAGIGNIYACEILFRAGIRPQKPAGKITQMQAQDIYRISVEVLKEAIRYRGSSMRNYRDAAGQKGEFKKRIQVYAREGESCYVCQTPIQRIIQAGRSSFFCPHCQK